MGGIKQLTGVLMENLAGLTQATVLAPPISKSNTMPEEKLSNVCFCFVSVGSVLNCCWLETPCLIMRYWNGSRYINRSVIWKCPYNTCLFWTVKGIVHAMHEIMNWDYTVERFTQISFISCVSVYICIRIIKTGFFSVSESLSSIIIIIIE